jgi:hypothetical protein
LKPNDDNGRLPASQRPFRVLLLSGEPDLMWDLDLYARLDLADAWAILACA